ncbi:MAG: tRNA-dependent cyclodipeptide synthase [Alphaproteobacteria bacterium]
MTSYKVIVRNSPNWREHKAATLGVSVISPNWQGNKFAAILQFAAANFKTIRIDVTDALYRHGFMVEGMEEKQALAHANSLGALWLTDNADVIAASPVKPIIVRWAGWYRHPDYQKTLSDFWNAYNINPVLKNAVHDDIMDFYRRKGCEPSSREYEGSRDYFIEELAVSCLQGRELPSVKIYPGDELRCFHIVRNGLIPEAPHGLENEQFAKIKFGKRSTTPDSLNKSFLVGFSLA